MIEFFKNIKKNKKNIRNELIKVFNYDLIIIIYLNFVDIIKFFRKRQNFSLSLEYGFDLNGNFIQFEGIFLINLIEIRLEF